MNLRRTLVWVSVVMAHLVSVSVLSQERTYSGNEGDLVTVGGMVKSFAPLDYENHPDGNIITINFNSSDTQTWPNNVLGAYSSTSSVTNNQVMYIQGTTQQAVYGGYSTISDALNNRVEMHAGQVGWLFGGFSASGIVSQNSVQMFGGAVNNSVAGGEGHLGKVENNLVNITGGTVSQNVYGGFNTSSGNYGVNNNQVDMSGATVHGDVYGGYIANQGNGGVTGNSVHISGGHVLGDVYGGRVNALSTGWVTSNTVRISGGTIDGNIFGGVGSSPDKVKNNTLIFDGFQGTVAGIDGFDHYDFILPSGMTNGDTQVVVSTNAPDLNGAHVRISGMGASNKTLQIGDQLTLLSATTNSNQVASLDSERFLHGIIYSYDFSLVNDPNTLTVRVDHAEANPQLKSLSTAQLGALAFINQNADELSSVSSDLVKRAMTQPIFSNSILTFARVNGGDSRYKTGSHVDVKGVSLLSGVAGYLRPTWLAGLFVEAGRGDFSSFNDFEEMSSISARGNSRYYGGGILTRNDWEGGFYMDSALRLGQVETQYDSSDLFYLTASHYKTKALYFGAQAGLGYQMELQHNFLLDLSARYLWNRQNGNSVTVAGDPTEIHLQAINSHRSRAQAKVSYQGKLFSPFVHVAYENEFDSFAKAQVLGAEVPASSLAGGTGIGGVGVHIQSNNSRSYLNVRAQGFLGERQGYSAQLEAGWVF